MTRGVLSMKHVVGHTW